MKRLILIKILLAIMLFPTYQAHADIDITEIAGLYDRFQDEYKHLSPVFGLIVLKSGTLANIRLQGNYGPKNDNYLCHKQINDLNKCPQDNTTAIIQHLFPSPAGELAISNARSDLFGQIPIDAIGKLLKAYVQNESVETFKQILKTSSKHTKSIGKAWKNIFDKTNTASSSFNMLIEKYAEMFSRAKSESRLYPDNIIESALLALAVKKASSINDLQPLLDELKEFQKQEKMPHTTFSKDIYDYFKQKLNDKQTLQQTFNDLLSDPKLLIFITLAHDEYDNFYPSMIGTGIAYFENNPFSDCGETSLRNFLNLMIGSDGIFNVDRLKELFPHVSDQLLDFYINYQQTYRNIHVNDTRNYFANTVSGLNSPDKTYVKYNNGTYNISSGIDNMFAVIENVLGDSRFAEVRAHEQDPSKRRQAILDYLLNQFSREGFKLGWKVNNNSGKLENLTDIIITINGEDKFIWGFEDGHFMFQKFNPFSRHPNQKYFNEWRKYTNILISLLQNSPSILKNTLLPFYLNSDQKTANILKSNLTPEELLALAPNILYGLNLDGAEQKLEAINMVASFNAFEANQVVAAKWLEAIANMNDEAMNKKIVIACHNLSKNIDERHDFFNNNSSIYNDFFINNLPIAYQLSKETLQHLYTVDDDKLFEYWPIDYSEQMIKIILFTKVMLKSSILNMPILYYAIKLEHAAIIDMLLEIAPQLATNIEVTRENIKGKNSLHYAVEGGNYEIVEMLLEKAPQLVINIELAKDIQGKTPLHYAVERGNYEIVEILLNKAPRLAIIKDIEDKTAVHFAAINKRFDMMKILLIAEMSLEKYPPLNNLELVKDIDNQTLLYYAIYLRYAEIVEILLEKVPQLITNPEFVKDIQGKTLLHYAAECGNHEIVEILLKKAPHLVIIKDIEDKTAVHFAAINKHFDIMRILLIAEMSLENYPPLNNPELVLVKDINNQTLLYYAIYSGYVETVKEFIEKSPELFINPECAKDRNGRTALHYAVAGHTEILEILLKQAPQLSTNPELAKDNQGRTALHYAVAGSSEIVQMLIEKAPQLITNRQLAKDIYGQTPLLYAIEGGNIGVINILRTINR